MGSTGAGASRTRAHPTGAEKRRWWVRSSVVGNGTPGMRASVATQLIYECACSWRCAKVSTQRNTRRNPAAVESGSVQESARPRLFGTGNGTSHRSAPGPIDIGEFHTHPPANDDRICKPPSHLDAYQLLLSAYNQHHNLQLIVCTEGLDRAGPVERVWILCHVKRAHRRGSIGIGPLPSGAVAD